MNLDGPIQCMHSLNWMIRYSVVSLPGRGKGPAQIVPTPPTGEGSSNTGVTDSNTSRTAQQSGESQDDETNTFAEQAVEQIEALVESFRMGKTKKAQTIFKISQILATESDGDDQLKSDSLERYAITLDGINALASKSAGHGKWFNPLLGKRKDGPGGGGGRHEESVRDNASATHQNDIDDFYAGLPQGDIPQLGDDGPSGGSSSSESLDNDPDDRGQSNKKQRIYESQMPWYINEKRIRSTNTNPSCNKTRDTLDIFQRDFAAVKR